MNWTNPALSKMYQMIDSRQDMSQKKYISGKKLKGMVSISVAVAFHEARARLQHFESGTSLFKWTFLLVQSNPTPSVPCRTAVDDSGGNKMLVYFVVLQLTWTWLLNASQRCCCRRRSALSGRKFWMRWWHSRLKGGTAGPLGPMACNNRWRDQWTKCNWSFSVGLSKQAHNKAQQSCAATSSPAIVHQQRRQTLQTYEKLCQLITTLDALEAPWLLPLFCGRSRAKFLSVRARRDQNV